jgi:protein gp37
VGDKTNIEWTDATWNPIRGCQRVSPGCMNCYAESVAARFSGPGLAYEGLAEFRIIGEGTPKERKEAHWTGVIHQAEDKFYEPLRWKRPRKIFVNSMSDLFILDGNPGDWVLDRLFAVMALSPQHVFQVLTKRPQRMLEYLSSPGRKSEIAEQMATVGFDEITLKGRSGRLPVGTSTEGDGVVRVADFTWPLPNVWMGVSVENQSVADERIPLLLQTPAAVRWISAEPLLGPVDIARWVSVAWQCSYCREYFSGRLQNTCPSCNRVGGWSGSHAFNPKYGQVGSGIDWLVAGGESGPGARPMHPEWARSLRDQCVPAKVPFFFKQWGEWMPIFHASTLPRDPKCRIHAFPAKAEEIGQHMWRVGRLPAQRRE